MSADGKNASHTLADVRARDALIFGGLLCSLMVAAGLLDEGSGRMMYFVAAGLLGAMSTIVVAPRRVWLRDGQIVARRWGRMQAIALSDIVHVSVEMGFKAGPYLFFCRSDGSGFSLFRLDEGSLAFRTQIGRQIAALGTPPQITREARSLLALDGTSN